MRRVALALTLMSGTAGAEEALPQVLYLTNDANRMIEQLAIFPVSDSGEVIDDVLLARHDPIAAHQTVALDVGLTKCGKISVWSRFPDGEEISGIVDLCNGNRLIAHD